VGKDIIDQLQTDWGQQRPDLDPGPMGVVLRIQALARMLGDQAAQCLQQFNLQWWQYDVLSTLRRQGKPFMMTATRLADSAMLTSGAMTNRIDRLESEGLVRRQTDPGDRRRVLVQLSKKGLKLVEKASEARFEAASEALEGLTAAQRKTLSDLLRLVIRRQTDRHSF